MLQHFHPYRMTQDRASQRPLEQSDSRERRSPPASNTFAAVAKAPDQGEASSSASLRDLVTVVDEDNNSSSGGPSSDDEQLQTDTRLPPHGKGKLPLALLNDVCKKVEVTPDVVTKKISDPSAGDMWECCISLECMSVRWTGKATSRSLKDAKQEAARALLLSVNKNVANMMLVRPNQGFRDYPSLLSAQVAVDRDRTGVFPSPPPPPPPPTETETEAKENENVVVQQTSSISNMDPIGELFHYCRIADLCEPKFVDCFSSGPAHDKTFTVQCSVGTVVVEAQEKPKKLAKKTAAMMMLEHLKPNKVDSKSKITLEQESSTQGISASGVGSSSSSTHVQHPHLQEWFVDLRNRARSGNGLALLKEDPVVGLERPIALLQRILRIENINLDVMQTGEKYGNQSERRYLLSLGTGPGIMIFFGEGDSDREAVQSASLQALRFLKIAVTE